MFEWLEGSMTNHLTLTYTQLAIRLILAFVFGGIVAGVYVLTQRKSRTELVPMATTLVLLTILIAMVTLIIGNNVARAFSLAGALAIIRFRTVVEDTRDTAFVIFAVVVGMGLGTDLIVIPLIGIPIVATAAIALSFCGLATSTQAVDYSLAIRFGLGRDPNTALAELFAKHLTQVRWRATTTARQGAALEVSYIVRLREQGEATSFVSELNRVDGVLVRRLIDAQLGFFRRAQFWVSASRRVNQRLIACSLASPSSSVTALSSSGSSTWANASTGVSTNASTSRALFGSG